MKTQDEIQRAHDILAAIILKEVPLQVKDEQMEGLLGSADVLCWMLEHEHNKSFQENLKRIEDAFQKMGIVESQTRHE
jgi:hypothetical protein